MPSAQRRPGRSRRIFQRLLLAALVTAGGGLFSGTVAAAELTGRDLRCAGCHFHPGLTRELGDGTRITLSLSPEAFARSEHAEKGCVGCHDDIKLPSHPQKRREIGSVQDYLNRAQQNCAGCHAEAAKAWQEGGHGRAVAAGREDAPQCLSCHDPHAPMAAAQLGAERVGLTDCATCHEQIGAAFATSVHAPHALVGGDRQPLCTDCHAAHAVPVAERMAGHAGTDCLACHAEAPRQHAAWLPNAALHLDSVACAACHTPQAARQLELRLEDASGRLRAATLPGGMAPLDAEALRLAVAGGTLRGRIDVADAAQAHALGSKENAVHACNTCHSPTSGVFSAIRLVSAPAPGEGSLSREVSPAAMASLGSLGTIGGFYLVGGPRVGALDWLVGLALLAGLGVPALHLLWGAWVRRHRGRETRP